MATSQRILSHTGAQSRGAAHCGSGSGPAPFFGCVIGEESFEPPPLSAFRFGIFTVMFYRPEINTLCRTHTHITSHYHMFRLVWWSPVFYHTNSVGGGDSPHKYSQCNTQCASIDIKESSVEMVLLVTLIALVKISGHKHS